MMPSILAICFFLNVYAVINNRTELPTNTSISKGVMSPNVNGEMTALVPNTKNILLMLEPTTLPKAN